MLESLDNKVREIVDGSITDYNFPIPLISPDQVVVSVDYGIDFMDNGFQKQVEVLTAIDYEIIEFSPLGCTVRLTKEKAKEISGYILEIRRVQSLKQELNLPEHNRLSSKALETQLDKIVMMIQQLKRSLDLCLKVPDGAEVDQDLIWENFLCLISYSETLKKYTEYLDEKLSELLPEILLDISEAITKHNDDQEAHSSIISTAVSKAVTEAMAGLEGDSIIAEHNSSAVAHQAAITAHNADWDAHSETLRYMMNQHYVDPTAHSSVIESAIESAIQEATDNIKKEWAASFPDYEKAVSRVFNTTYTAETNGFIGVYIKGPTLKEGFEFKLIVNNGNPLPIGLHLFWNEPHAVFQMFPIKAGDTYEIGIYHEGSSSKDTDSSHFSPMYFIPAK